MATKRSAVRVGVGLLLGLGLGACVGSLDAGPAGAGGDLAPVSALRPGVAGLRALTPAQYEASVRDVLGLGPPGSDAAPIAPLGQWSTAIAAARGGFSPTTVESYETGARDAALWATSDPTVRAEVVGCVPTADLGDRCVASFVARVGRRAYRRSLTAEEQSRWTTLASSVGVSLGDPWRGVEHALSGILQSPHFLYRVELGEDDPTSEDPARLRYTGHDMAARLAYLVWGSTPDEELLGMAERGELTTEEGILAALDRLLADPRAEVGLEAFVADLLEVDALATAEKDPALHPDFPEQRGPMRAQLVRTAATALAEEGFGGLFTTHTVFVDATTAPLLGLEAGAFDTTLTRVELPPEGPRAGVLTLPGFLAIHSYGGKTSPALRGLFVRRRLLCHDIPPPPPSVSTVLPESPDGRLVTTRELVSIHQRSPTCAGCHQYMDPIGLGLEQFDEIGEHRLLQNELAIDPSGELDGVPFDDAISLGAAIAEHPALGPCMASRLFAFGAGSTVPATDAAVEAIAAHGDDVRSMFREVVRSELFTHAWTTDTTDAGGGL